MAALLCHVRDNWNQRAKDRQAKWVIPASYTWCDDTAQSVLANTIASITTPNGRHSGLTLTFAHKDDQDEPLTSFRASRDLTGWRLDAFSGLLSQSHAHAGPNGAACTWAECIFFPSGPKLIHAGSSPFRVVCPVSPIHELPPERIAPWQLANYLYEDWLPFLVGLL